MYSAGDVTWSDGAVVMEVPRLRTRPPVEADGFFLRRNSSPQRTIRRDGESRYLCRARYQGGVYGSANGLWPGNFRDGHRSGGVCASAATRLCGGATGEAGTAAWPVASAQMTNYVSVELGRLRCAVAHFFEAGGSNGNTWDTRISFHSAARTSHLPALRRIVVDTALHRFA